EERVMPRRPPDFLEVVVLAGHPEDPLVVDGAGVAPLLGPGEDLLELDHAGVREEESLVARRDEAGARDSGVAAVLEELDEAFPDLGRRERRDPRIVLGNEGRHRPQWYRTSPSLPGSWPIRRALGTFGHSTTEAANEPALRRPPAPVRSLHDRSGERTGPPTTSGARSVTPRPKRRPNRPSHALRAPFCHPPTEAPRPPTPARPPRTLPPP